MAATTKIDGLVSGLDTTKIIQQLMALQQKPLDRLKAKIDTANQQKQAYFDISTKILSISTQSLYLNRTSLFDSTATASLLIKLKATEPATKAP